MYGRTRLLAAGCCCLVVMFLGCTDGTSTGPLEPEFAKGGKKGKPGASSLIELVGLDVQILTDGVSHGMTDDIDLDAAIAVARIDHEFLCRSGISYRQCEPQEQLTFFGCPDIEQPCSRIRYTFSGGTDQDYLRLQVSHSIQGCIKIGIVVGGCF